MNAKKKTTIFLLISLLLFFLFIFLLILPSIKKISETSKEISKTKARLEEISKQQEEIERFKKIFPDIKENLLKFENSFVSKEIPVDFVEFLEKMARDLQIRSEISILSSSKDSISFEIKGAGSPENVFKFLEKVENCNFLIQIERLRISKLTEAELKIKEYEGFSKNDLKFEVSFSVLTK
jgi:acylphosphatase